MAVEWLGPLVVAGYENREEIEKVCSGGLTFVLGKKTTIAITGTQGAGKSVLHDHLNGRAFKKGYKSPLQSQRMEGGKTQVKSHEGKKRLVFSVIPGQAESPQRFEALEDVFKKQATDGVIHVVPNGYSVTRKHDSIEYLIRESGIDTVEKYRKMQFERELADLKETCSRIVESHQLSRTPKWMIVVPAKLDLYSDDTSVAIARQRYSLHADNAMGECLRNLQNRVGTDFLAFDAAPACSIIEDFQWNGEVVKSTLDAEARNAYLAQLIKLIASYAK